MAIVHLRLHRIAAALAGCAVAGLAVSPALGQWGAVEIAAQSPNFPINYRNVDTMVLPDGTPVVGYSDGGITPTLSFVENGVVRDVVSPRPNTTTRFVADRFGIISYVGWSSGQGTTSFGSDFGSRQQIAAEQREELAHLSSLGVPGLALDANGAPLIAARSVIGGNQVYYLSRFDIPTEQWQLSTVASGMTPNFSSISGNATSAAYTADGRLVLATSNANQFELIVEQPGGLDLRVIQAKAGQELNTTSLATQDNLVAFAFQRASDRQAMVGIYDGTLLTYEAVAGSTLIAPGSLAFAPDGTLGFAYDDPGTGQITFAQRTGSGTWTYESLGVTGYLASLAYAADGTPYIGVSGSDRISLWSPALDPFWGDLNADFAVDQEDLNVVLTFFGTASDGPGYSTGDANLDGLTDVNDLNLLLRYWTSEQAPVFNVPEPGSGLALLALLTAALAPKRRGQHA